jgi:NADPH:quinone reductase-like Zn-dependent oxidoreductase
MRRWIIDGAFGLDHLRLEDHPEPEPGPGEVMLRMRAASLNYRDLLTVQGLYNPKQPLPLVPCSDGVGEVMAVGEGVERFGEGDRVATLFSQGWLKGEPTAAELRKTLGGPIDGTLTERMVLPSEGVIAVPEHLTDVEVACLPCAGLTAWSALVELGGVTAGDVVLVQGTGGVSLFALQFATVLGARAIVTSSSDAKLERARELGAWRTINYREDSDWGKTARKMTDGVGVDHVVEVGGAGTLQQSLRAVRVGGTISMIGVLSGTKSEIDLIPVLMQQVRIQGILVGSREGFERMNRAVAASEMRPVVDREIPFEEAPEAFAVMQRAGHFGKIAVEIS